MSFDTVGPLIGSRDNGNGKAEDSVREWDRRLKQVKENAEFRGDNLLADKKTESTGLWYDLWRVLTPKNAAEVLQVAITGLQGKGLDQVAGAQLIGSLPNDSKVRAKFIESQVGVKYEKMLHPPITYLGDAFQYRAPDGKFNSVLHPHLGAAGAPYAKTVPSKTHPLGALPDPGDVFDKLMAREEGGRDSIKSGLSSMLIYHATIIIHDIFRTNDADKNLSDSSSYLDLSPLYGYTMKMQRKVRDDKFKLGLLKPDTFAEDRLLRQPPGVCIMLVMYNRYHNYAATQLKRINENGKFSVPAKFQKTKWLAIAESRECVPDKKRSDEYVVVIKEYEVAWEEWLKQGQKPLDEKDEKDEKYPVAEKNIRDLLNRSGDHAAIEKFSKAYDAAWDKLDDDLFNTARLITCGIYVNISIHDYLRALMGFHQFNTNFTLDPRLATNHKNVSRGLGNQVTVEFNLLYRFHCAISRKDEEYTERFMLETLEEVAAKAAHETRSAKRGQSTPSNEVPDPKNLSLMQFATMAAEMSKESKKDPWLVEFGLKNYPAQSFRRNTITGLFDDKQMIEQLLRSMDDPISNFGPRNVPQCLKNVEIMGILQARKWEVGTLNDFRDFFGLGRHETFEQITKNVDVQNALRDLYDHPDKVELYPGIFCESDENKSVDPGPSDVDSALWAAIFSDAITLVRSDRFYTVDWNTNTLTSWGMEEVTPDNDVLKSSVFHRLLQRAFPEWFPYDSIRFFHPFYTAQKNAEYAEQQGYQATFKMSKDVSGQSKYNCKASEPEKPPKPLYLNKYSDIKWVLSTGADEIIHPAFAEPANLPEKVQEALRSIRSKNAFNESDSPENEKITKVEKITKAYFAHQMRAIVEREVITMSTGKDGSVFQLDVTRDLAIPVITRCIADFLGFGSEIKDVENPKAKYSENEVYQHITNCQTFLSYNADETKLLKRRTDFKNSMEFLLKLAEGGSILEASRWPIGRVFKNFGESIAKVFEQRSAKDDRLATEPMKALGQAVAARILEEVKDSGKAAAVLLLTALDIAYISVLAFTASLDHLLQGGYDFAKTNRTGTCEWFEIQKLAIENDDADDTDELIRAKVLEAQKLSIRLPFTRKVVKDGLRIDANGREETLKKGQIIICDIVSLPYHQKLSVMELAVAQMLCGLGLTRVLQHEAMNPKDEVEAAAVSKLPHLNYASSLSAGLVHFNPKDIAVHGLTAMIKVMAQMKNLRRSHTAQGFVKKIEIDQTYEGYANFMAPGRMQVIAHDAETAPQVLKTFRKAREYNLEPAKSMSPEEADAHLQFLEQQVKDAPKVFSQDILKPKSDTYLTAEWDKMIPFPTTWKLRFEGYGPSTYGGPSLPKLRPDPQPDSYPPFYQPQGPSRYGGIFADNNNKNGSLVEETPADWVEVKSKGCGAPVPVLHSASEEVGAVAIEGRSGEGGGGFVGNGGW